LGEKLDVIDRTIADAICSRTLHFGDPPNLGCCINPDINSEPRRVIEHWRRHHPKCVQCKGNSDMAKDMAFDKWA